MEYFYVVTKVSRVSHFAALDRVKFAQLQSIGLIRICHQELPEFVRRTV